MGGISTGLEGATGRVMMEAVLGELGDCSWSISLRPDGTIVSGSSLLGEYSNTQVRGSYFLNDEMEDDDDDVDNGEDESEGGEKEDAVVVVE